MNEVCAKRDWKDWRNTNLSCGFLLGIESNVVICGACREKLIPLKSRTTLSSISKQFPIITWTISYNTADVWLVSENGRWQAIKIHVNVADTLAEHAEKEETLLQWTCSFSPWDNDGTTSSWKLGKKKEIVIYITILFSPLLSFYSRIQWAIYFSGPSHFGGKIKFWMHVNDPRSIISAAQMIHSYTIVVIDI